MSDVSLRPLGVEEAEMYGQLTGMAGWGHSAGILSDIIQALLGYVWGAFLSNGMLVSKNT